VTGRQGRRLKQLLDYLEKREFYNMKEETLNRSLWRTRFGMCYGTVVRLHNE
jgi:hypothetical protein